MGEQIIHRSLALLPTKQRGRGGHDDELVEFRRGHLAGESQARTRVIAEQVWEGELFACLAQPCHCIVLLMTLARGTLYAEQAIHCEESHNSTFTRVHLIACYAAVCVLQYLRGAGWIFVHN